MSEFDESLFKFILVEVVLRKNYGFQVIDKFNDNVTCPICTDTMKDTVVLCPPCDKTHIFHYQCLMECIIEHDMLVCPSCSANNGLRDEYLFQQETKFTYPAHDNVREESYGDTVRDNTEHRSTVYDNTEHNSTMDGVVTFYKEPDESDNGWDYAKKSSDSEDMIHYMKSEMLFNDTYHGGMYNGSDDCYGDMYG
jgi:hypothetical protein